MIADLVPMTGYIRGLRRYLSSQLTAGEANRLIASQMQRRSESFLALVNRGIYEQQRSPYRLLLEHLRIEFGDIAREVRQRGVEGALERLHDAGAYITLDEFKGRRPIRRGDFELQVGPYDFDNPLLARDYEASSGGSRSTGRRVVIDFDLLVHEAAYLKIAMQTYGVSGRPIGLWRAAPPVSSGMKQVLRCAKAGEPVKVWFSTNALGWRPDRAKFTLFTYLTGASAQLWGGRLAMPQHVPQSEAIVIARWLAEQVEAGSPGLCDTNASGAVFICQAARHAGLNMQGTLLRVTGEPYTEAKAEILTAIGCRGISHYSMAEIGNIGLGCALPDQLDEQHLLTDKLAIIQRPRKLGLGDLSVDTLVYTTILPSCPKLMLNVESDDYGVLGRRRCGCPFEELGFDLHLHTIRSYEKLTGQGVTFLGTELVRLIENVLPQAFGGDLTDYQLVEQEIDGVARVGIVISPRIGPIDDRRVISTAIDHLSRVPGGPEMTNEWRQSGTLFVERRETYQTTAAKILPLHLVRKKAALVD